jgi:hypothetical protein
MHITLLLLLCSMLKAFNLGTLCLGVLFLSFDGGRPRFMMFTSILSAARVPLFLGCPHMDVLKNEDRRQLPCSWASPTFQGRSGGAMRAVCVGITCPHITHIHDSLHVSCTVLCVSLGALNQDITVSSQQDLIYFSHPNANNIDFDDFSFLYMTSLMSTIISLLKRSSKYSYMKI